MLRVNLSIFLYEEGGYFICESPALDVVGQGTTKEEAIESFEIVLSEFISYSLNKKRLSKNLFEMGWGLEDGETLDDLDNFQNLQITNVPVYGMNENFTLSSYQKEMAYAQ